MVITAILVGWMLYRVASPIHYLKFSSDNHLFASAPLVRNNVLFGELVYYCIFAYRIVGKSRSGSSKRMVYLCVVFVCVCVCVCVCV